MNGNLGETVKKHKTRKGNPMHTYDALPTPLRRWLSEAVLPWSPHSARRIWERAIARGLSHEDALQSLKRAEEKTLMKERMLQ